MQILDATCGTRSMWYQDPDFVTFMDLRSGPETIGDVVKWKRGPDLIGDFREMPFASGYFDLVVFDPPHLTESYAGNGEIAKKYGYLFPTWEADLRAGLEECFRVCKDKGFIIFKWSEVQISSKRVLDLIDKKPLFGHGTRSNTIWLLFLNTKSATVGSKNVLDRS